MRPAAARPPGQEPPSSRWLGSPGRPTHPAPCLLGTRARNLGVETVVNCLMPPPAAPLPTEGQCPRPSPRGVSSPRGPRCPPSLHWGPRCPTAGSSCARQLPLTSGLQQKAAGAARKVRGPGPSPGSHSSPAGGLTPIPAPPDACRSVPGGQQSHRLAAMPSPRRTAFSAWLEARSYRPGALLTPTGFDRDRQQSRVLRKAGTWGSIVPGARGLPCPDFPLLKVSKQCDRAGQAWGEQALGK